MIRCQCLLHIYKGQAFQQRLKDTQKKELNGDTSIKVPIIKRRYETFIDLESMAECGSPYKRSTKSYGISGTKPQNGELETFL